MPRRYALPAPRVVLDTQLLLRGALARTQSLTARIYEAWRVRQFALLVSDPILSEIETVVARPELLCKLRVTPRETRAMVVRLRRHAMLIRSDVTIRMSRDPTDDKFLECAVAGRADYVVSGDADLLSLREVQGIPIIDAPTFWQALTREARS